MANKAANCLATGMASFSFRAVKILNQVRDLICGSAAHVKTALFPPKFWKIRR
jgi:hypothetical protein